MNKFAIFTACIGGYDDIMQPKIIDERFDYYLFTDDVEENQIGVWQVRHVDYTNPDKTRVARYVKTHPEELLPEYDATLWIDSNIQIISDSIYNRFISLFEEGIDLASVKHPDRDCIYDEAYTVVSWNMPFVLEHDCLALSWCRKIWKDGYREHGGLYETNILYRRNDELMAKVDKMWWNCISGFSKRDQLSFNYVLWKFKPTAGFFLPIGENAKNSSQVAIANHNGVAKRKYVELGFWELLRYRLRHVSPTMQTRSEKHWHGFYKSPFPLLAQWLWGVVYGIWYSPLFMSNIVKHRKKNNRK